MSAMQKAKYDTVELTPMIGVAIECRVDTLLSGEISQHIRDVLEERGVVVFRQINLTDEQQIAFTKTIGVFAPEDEIKQGVFKVSLDANENAQADYLKSGFFWHIDGTMDRLPIRASIMSARRLPREGSQTEWTNTYAAYEALSAEDKELVSKLRVRHTLEALHSSVYPEPTYEQLVEWRKHASRTLPMVWNHASGRKSVIVGNSCGFVENMDRDESRLMLARIRDHCTQRQFVYSHDWTVGDMVMWDNCGTMHRAIRYAVDSGRLMHRTKIKGEEDFA